MSELIEITDADISDISESTIKRVTEVFNQFLKTVKAKQVYPASSKLPQQFFEGFFAQLNVLLDDLGKITFKVEADGIFYGDHQVYKARSRTENFAHPFFRDGIIEFEFRKNVGSVELEQFVDIITLMMRSALVEDDLATLFWEVGFEHISYKLMDDSLDIETFEYGTDSLKTGNEPSKSDMDRLFENEVDLEFTDEDFDLESEKNRPTGRPLAYRDVPDNVAEYINKITEYDESEKAAISGLLADDAAFDYKNYVIDVLFELLGLETDGASYNETLDLISKISDDFIKDGDFRSALSLLERTKELGDAFKNLKDEKQTRLEKFIERFSGSDKIRIIVEVVNRAKDINYTEIADYLKMLSWQAIDPLIWALGELEHYPARRAICQALELLAVEHIEILGKGTENPRWYVVRNVVSVLGKIGSTTALDYFRRTINHSDLRVRKETVISAAKIGSEAAADFLILALDDESDRLQILALKELVNQKMGKAFPQIERMITQKKFKNRSAEQIREILEAYAKLGGQKAFERLKKIARRKMVIPSEKQDRLRNYAIRALGFIPTPAVTQVLEKISRSRNRKLADTAKRTLIRRARGESLV